jgi:hypothetical protein
VIGDDWFDLLTEFRNAEVRLLVVGAHAMAVHGFPRATRELDLWLDPAQRGQLIGPARQRRGAAAAIAEPRASLSGVRGCVPNVGVPPSRT